jgi:hypothetical protein
MYFKNEKIHQLEKEKKDLEDEKSKDSDLPQVKRLISSISTI